MIRRLAMTVLTLTLGTGVVPAAERASSPHIFGSYAVVQATNVGQETKVELRLRLTNPSGQAVFIEKVLLSSMRPLPNKTLPAPILLSAHGMQEIVQEFTIPTPEYQSWQRGLRPLLHVEMRTQEGDVLRQTVRLNRGRSREEK